MGKALAQHDKKINDLTKYFYGSTYTMANFNQALKGTRCTWFSVVGTHKNHTIRAEIGCFGAWRV